jgi:hypothetical protein
MKVVAVTRDYSFRASARVFVLYREGVEYQRVPEAHARAIEAAGAGTVVKTAADE